MYILYIIVLKIKLITNLHALSVAIHVPPNSGIFDYWCPSLQHVHYIDMEILLTFTGETMTLQLKSIFVSIDGESFSNKLSLEKHHDK